MKSIFRLLVSSLIALTVSSANASAATSPWSSLIVFGDSLSDPGNASLLAGGPVALYDLAGYVVDGDGHFSNGKTAAELLADRLIGIDSTTLAWAPGGGNNFAVGGALSGAGHRSPSLSFTGIASQVARFTPSTGFDPSSTLFLIQGGGNDILQAFDYTAANTLTLQGQEALFNAVINDASSNMAGNILTLGLKGATNILWATLPDLGLTPGVVSQGPAFAAFASALSNSFNESLEAKIAFVDSQLDAIRGFDVNIFEVDTAKFVRDSAQSGALDMNAPCLFVPNALPSCTGLFFYDPVHPTTAAHQLFADRLFAAAVPEPSEIAMMLVGLVLVAGIARRRRQATH